MNRKMQRKLIQYLISTPTQKTGDTAIILTGIWTGKRVYKTTNGIIIK